MVIYLNNFKGFTDTFIPLKKVNFFVGENSTGKSTVLSILELLSKPSFWTSPQFNTSEVHFGPFKEVVNQFSKDRSFFQIGAEFETRDLLSDNNSKIFFRILETFREQDGNVVLDSFQYMQSDRTIYCSGLTKHKTFVSSRTKHFLRFSDWVHSSEPLRRKEISFPSKEYLWLPILMNRLQEFLHIKGDNMHLFFPSEFPNFTVISPVRAEAHRIYESFSQSYSPQGEHIPFVLNKITQSSSASNKAIVNRLCSFGQNSNLFDSISTPRFGDTSDAPFTVSVGYDKIKINLTNVGYGVTQSLPLVVEILNSNNTSFSIQQPEVHLHPKAQAAFGDFMYESVVKNKNLFFCETHSDYIINRFRYAMNKGHHFVDAQVLFFTRDDKGTHVSQILIDQDGHYEDVPKEYMSFFIDEELKMLEF